MTRSAGLRDRECAEKITCQTVAHLVTIWIATVLRATLETTMTSRFSLVTCGLLIGLALIPGRASAAMMLDYSVNIVQAGPVPVGSTVDWELFVTVSGTPETGDNFGIATASVNLVNEPFNEPLGPGTIDPAFAGYPFQSGGTFNAPVLQSIGALQLTQDESSVGLNSGSFLLASGSYEATQEGLHTLRALMSVDDSTYFTEAGQLNFQASVYDIVTFGSDSVMAAVPEPCSLAVLGLGACGFWLIRRRRQKTALRDTDGRRSSAF